MIFLNDVFGVIGSILEYRILYFRMENRISQLKMAKNCMPNFEMARNRILNLKTAQNREPNLNVG